MEALARFKSLLILRECSQDFETTSREVGPIPSFGMVTVFLT